MLYIKPFSKPAMKNKSAGFSLVEILMTLLVVALILIGVTTILTKKAGSRQTEGVVYTYKGNNTIATSGSGDKTRCWITLQDGDNYNEDWEQFSNDDKKNLKTKLIDNSLTLNKLKFAAAKECTEYEFVVPKDVHSVNLTLVAGGGGGGGAAGGSIQKLEEVKISNNENLVLEEKIDVSELKDVKINFFTGRGQRGQQLTTHDITYIILDHDFYLRKFYVSGSYHYTYYKSRSEGRGGKSSAAIYDYYIPHQLFRHEHENQADAGSNFGYQIGRTNPGYDGDRSWEYSPINFKLIKQKNTDLDQLVQYVADYNGIKCCSGNTGCTITSRGSAIDDRGYHDYNVTEINSCTNLIPRQNIYTSREAVSANNGVTTITSPQNGSRPFRSASYTFKSVIGINTTFNFGFQEGSKGGFLPIYQNYGYGGQGEGTVASIDRCTQTCNMEGQISPDGVCHREDSWGGHAVFYTVRRQNDVDNPGFYCEGISESNDEPLQMVNGQVVPSCPGDTQRSCGTRDNENCQKTEKIYKFNCPKQDGWTGEPGQGYLSFSYIAERPGGVGGGGSGGTYVQIKNFKVEPGETYVIRIGKGGDGGSAGKEGKRKIKHESDGTVKWENDPYIGSTDGQNGVGGVSTSIWKKDGENEIPIFIVMGGAGGQGGKIYSGDGEKSYSKATSEDNIADKDRGLPGRSIPLLLVNKNNDVNGNFNSSKFGTDKIGNNTDCNGVQIVTSEGTSANINNLKSYCLSYPDLGFGQNKTPYSSLAYLNRNGNTTNKAQNWLSGFSAFDIKDTDIAKIDGISYLSSYYYRTLIGSDIGYVGGLGGFSGLGGKAGCGGLFMGNINGYKKQGGKSDTDFDSKGARKIYLETNKGDYNMKDVSDYYDNCTIDTPNGQSANFVSPSPQRKTLGQAGAGGGGGGYHMFKGAGNGGAGQNGYLMIDWRK